MMNPADEVAEAVAHFEGRLRFETDPSDVHSALESGDRFVLVDSRGEVAWRQGRIRKAVHLPTAEIPQRARAQLDLDMPIVVYCWGPGCNGATRAALAFSQLGYSVKEMIGGYEYWAREGYPTEDDQGPIVRAVDELTAPRGAIACDC